MSDDEIEFWRECTFVADDGDYAKKYDPSTGRIAVSPYNAFEEEEEVEEDG
jgi:hypothetical protein